MSAQDLEKEVRNLRKQWRGLWWKMAGEVKSEYERIQGTDVFEFFPLYDLWLESVKKRTKDINTLHKKSR